MSAQQIDVAIIGAGIAGLLAATALREQGYRVVVVDKGRGVGGRMATRRVGDHPFDHGTQYFTVTDPRFGQWVERWVAAGTVRPWFNELQTAEGPAAGATVQPRYVALPSMTGLPKALAQTLTAQGVEIRTSWRVSRLALDCDGWTIWGENLAAIEPGGFESIEARALLVTSPLPQTLELFHNSDIELEKAQADELASVDYAPCWSLMILANRDGLTLPDSLATALQEPGGAKGLNAGEPVGWIADNSRKLGLSDKERVALTIQAGPQWSRDHLEDSPESVRDALLGHSGITLAEGALLDWQAHRWRYSFPSNPLGDTPTLRLTGLPPCWLAGDAFGPRGKVETAALSGLSAAEQLALLVPLPHTVA